MCSLFFPAKEDDDRLVFSLFARSVHTGEGVSSSTRDFSISLFNSMMMISHVCILSSFSLRDAKRIKEQFSSSKEEENNKLSSTLVVFKRTPRIWY